MTLTDKINDGNDSNENRAEVELLERVRQLLPRLDALVVWMADSVTVANDGEKYYAPRPDPLPKELSDSDTESDSSLCDSSLHKQAAALLRECLEYIHELEHALASVPLTDEEAANAEWLTFDDLKEKHPELFKEQHNDI